MKRPKRTVSRPASGKPDPEQMTPFEKVHYEHQSCLPMWTVYGPNTSDYPGKYLARLCFTLPQVEMTDCLIIRDTLQEVRMKLPRGLFWMDRKPEDDPVILEVWL
jgi:hypothetical protein